MTFILLVALIIIAGVALRLAVPTLSGTSAISGIVSVNGNSTLGDCPDTPNCQGSESTRSQQRLERFALSKPAADSIETLAAIVKSQPRTQIVTQTDRYLHATFATKIMGYIDDVEFLVSDDGQSVQARSASRIGKSDLGANARRMDLLRTLAEGRI